MEKVNFGILGFYSIEDIICDDDFDSDDMYYDFIKDTLNKYNESLEEINRMLIYKMYYSLSSCGFPMWEEEGFKKVIDEEKLPNGFYDMTEDEKYNTLYGFEFNKDDIVEKINTNVPFLNIDKFKNDININNVFINKNLSEISIEFEGFCNFFNAMVTFVYSDNFRISEFHVS